MPESQLEGESCLKGLINGRKTRLYGVRMTRQGNIERRKGSLPRGQVS
jgi:hypothetical protein